MQPPTPRRLQDSAPAPCTRITMDAEFLLSYQGTCLVQRTAQAYRKFKKDFKEGAPGEPAVIVPDPPSIRHSAD